MFSLQLVNRHGATIDLNRSELGSLPKDIAAQFSNISPEEFKELELLQSQLVQRQMTTAYTIMFAICALAYIVAWLTMTRLVPKSKRIDDL